MSIPPVAAANDAPSGAGSVLMQVAGLSKRYGDRGALAGVSFDVHAGEVLGLIGPNGAGKTTLLETVAGLLPADSGEVIWRGAAVHAGRRREVLFYLPDGLRPWEDQYVTRVLDFFASAYGRTHREVSRTVWSVGLSPVLGKRVFALSKGGHSRAYGKRRGRCQCGLYGTRGGDFRYPEFIARDPMRSCSVKA